MLRIIAGQFKGRRLKTIETPGTRPMTDRVRESLFSILMPELPGVSFLDIFSGSGAVGLEAISRGAESAVFVERTGSWVKVIEENIESLNLGDQCVLLSQNAYAAVERFAEDGKTFDIVFAGPPYDKNHHNRILESVTDSAICSGTIVIQYRATDKLLLPPGFSVDTRTYGITSLSFIRKEND